MLKKSPLPKEYMRFITHATAEKMAECDVFSHVQTDTINASAKEPTLIVHFPQAGGVYPCHIGAILQQDLTIHHNHTVTALIKRDKQWILQFNTGQKTPPVDTVIICGGADSLHIDGLNIPPSVKNHMIHFNRGQLSWIPLAKTAKHQNPPKVAMGGQGYTAHAPLKNCLIFGATWDKLTPEQYAQKHWQTLNPQDHIRNRDKVAPLLPQLGHIDTDKIHGRVAIRATVPDRMPLLGFLDNGLFLATGYGARGLQYAPLFSHICRHMLWNLFPPCSNKNIDHTNPKRFFMTNHI